MLSGDTALANSLSTSVLDRFPVIGMSIQGDHLKGSALALIVGIVLALWSGSGVTGAMANALEHVWEIPRAKWAGFVQTKIRGLLLLLIIGVLFTVGSGASGVVTGGLGGGALTAVAGIVLSLLTNLALFLATFHFLCQQPPGFRDLIPGAALAAVFWTVLQALGGVYIDHIKHSDSAYGVFALVLGILTWLHLGTQLTLYAVEFNTVLVGKRWPRSLFSAPDEQPAQARPLGGDEPVPGPPLNKQRAGETADQRAGATADQRAGETAD